MAQLQYTHTSLNPNRSDFPIFLTIPTMLIALCDKEGSNP